MPHSVYSGSIGLDSDDSDVVAGDDSYFSSSSLLLSAVGHSASVSTHGVAHCRQELHATISSVVVSRYTRNDTFGSLNSTSPPTYAFNSLDFHSRVFSAAVCKCVCGETRY